MSQMNSFLVQERREAGIMCRVQGCEREFVDMNRRDEHEKSVHDRIRLKCDLCPKSYSLSAKTSLNYHKLVSHAQGPKQPEISNFIQIPTIVLSGPILPISPRGGVDLSPPRPNAYTRKNQ